MVPLKIVFINMVPNFGVVNVSSALIQNMSKTATPEMT